MSDYKLNVIPRYYGYKSHTIPRGLSALQSMRYIMGCGASTATASTLAIHDRACSLAVRLATLVEQSGNADLKRRAELEIQKWNDECDELFQSQG